MSLQLRRIAEEEKQKLEEELSWVRGILKEEKEEIYQQKQKLKWMAEVEIERLKEGLLQ